MRDHKEVQPRVELRVWHLRCLHPRTAGGCRCNDLRDVETTVANCTCGTAPLETTELKKTKNTEPVDSTNMPKNHVMPKNS